jgi:putative methyltransferase (TIGR04325 family)
VNLSPIALFVFNRPWHTAQTLDALNKNELADQSVLYIYADGPKPGSSEEELENIFNTRRIIKEKSWCKEVHIIESEYNFGLAKSIVNGVSQVIDKHGMIIVLEDDIIVSPYFLKYMNEGLEIYKDQSEVISIHAYNYPIKTEGIPETFFIKGADCWGWATWAPEWKLLDMDCEKLLGEIEGRSLQYEFDINGSYPYTQMLRQQKEKKISSWAICWYASAFLHNKYTLYPKTSLIYNIGFDKTGTHKADFDYFNNDNWNNSRPVQIDISTPVENNTRALSLWREYHEKCRAPFKNKPARNRNLIKRFGAKVYRKITQTNHRTTIPASSMWSGKYKSWKTASDKCSGYDAGSILEKVKSAVLEVKHGKAAYERDSVTFRKLEYSHELLHIFESIASKNNNTLDVVDFGGSLGSTYFQYRQLLTSVKLSWKVVEQQHYVDTGKKFIEDEQLKFYYTIKESIGGEKAKVLFLGSVLQYLEKPSEFVNDIMSYGFDYIIIDRTAFIEDSRDRLTIQNVPESIYKASYPVWFFNKENFIKLFTILYRSIKEFSSEVSSPVVLEDGKHVHWSGFLFEKK